MAKSLCSVLFAAAILLAPAAGVAGGRGCECVKQCPMHAHRLPCHEASHAKPCHGKVGTLIQSAGCGHEAADASPLPTLRAVVPDEMEISPVVKSRSASLVAIVPPASPVAEILTPPPEVLLAVA